MPNYSRDIGTYPVRRSTFLNGAYSDQFLGNQFLYREVGQHSDTVRRKFPVDPWRDGTSWNRLHEELECVSLGRKQESAIQSVTAPPFWWYSGDGLRTNTSEPPNGLAGALRAKIKDQNVNLAQSLVEYRQTADLFHGACQDAWRLFRSLRSGKVIGDIARFVRSPRDSIERNIANQWLRYQFGLKPVILDVYGSAAELRKVLHEGKRLRVSVREKQNLSYIHKHPNVSSSDPFAGTSTCNIKHRLRYVAQYSVSDSSIKTLSQIGITNPAALAWEVVPFSFVIDWLFPVGNWLSSLDALVGVGDLSYYKVQHTTKDVVGSAYGGSFTGSHTSYSRSSKFTNLALPRFAYTPSKSLIKVVTGLALLKQIKPR